MAPKRTSRRSTSQPAAAEAEAAPTQPVYVEKSSFNLRGCLIVTLLLGFLLFMFTGAVAAAGGAWWYFSKDDGGGGGDRERARVEMVREIDAAMNSDTESDDAYLLAFLFDGAAKRLDTDASRSQPIMDESKEFYQTKEELLGAINNLGAFGVQGNSADQYRELPSIIERHMRRVLDDEEQPELTPAMRREFIEMLRDLGAAFYEVSGY